MSAGAKYQVAIRLKDDGLLKKLETLEAKGVTIKRISERAATLPTSPIEQIKMTKSEINNALKGVVDTGPGRRKSLPTSQGVEARPEGPTAIGVNYGGGVSAFGGLITKLSTLTNKIPLIGPIFAKLEATLGKTLGGLGKSLSGGGGMFGKLEGMNAGMLLKMGAIGAGIGTLVTLMAKSSGALQGVFKLWETSIMLIFKPMGDFFAMILRPISIALLTNFIIPYYKTVYPWFRDWGKKIGEALVNLPKTIVDGISGIGKFLGDVGGGISAGFTLAGAGLQKAWDDFVNTLTQTLTPIPSTIFNVLAQIGTNIWNTLSNIGNVFWGYLSAIGSSIWQTLSNIPNIFWGYLSTIGQSLWQTLSNIPQVFWGYLQSIAQSIWDTLSTIPDQFVSVFTGLASSIASALAGVPEAIKNAILSFLARLVGGGGGGGSAPLGSNSSSLQRSRNRTTMMAIADTV